MIALHDADGCDALSRERVDGLVDQGEARHAECDTLAFAERASDDMRAQEGLAGVVVACPEDPENPYYAIRFPGWNATVRMHASALEPAIPIGPVSTSRGAVASIDAAETALVGTVARLRAGLRSAGGVSEDDERDLIRLSAELGRVCGLSEHELIRQLDPWITVRTAEYVMTGAEPGGPAHLAASDTGHGENPGRADAATPVAWDPRASSSAAPRRASRRR